MTQISMKEFLRTGRFGLVELGASRDTVEKCLGQPDDYSTMLSKKNRKPVIYKYGGVELHFDEDSDNVMLIFIDDFRTKSSSVDLWIINSDLRTEQAEDELRQQGISCRKEKGKYIKGRTHLITECGAYLVFDEGDDDDRTARLSAVGISEHGPWV